MHNHVIRDARTMLLELYGENSLLRFEEVYADAQNRTYSCIRFPKKEIFILVTGYSIPLRMAVITRVENQEKQIQSNELTPAPEEVSMEDWDFIPPLLDTDSFASPGLVLVPLSCRVALYTLSVTSIKESGYSSNPWPSSGLSYLWVSINSPIWSVNADLPPK